MSETFQLGRKAAQAYEAVFVPAFFAQWAPHLLGAAGVRGGDQVLDVACGTGVVARAAREVVGPSGRVLGVDLSQAMLDVARQVRPDLAWQRGDAAALPFDVNSVDVAVCQMAMMFFPDPVVALREMGRVARRAVAVLVPAALAANPPFVRFSGAVADHAGVSARGLVTTYFALGDAQGLAASFTRAGLRVTSTRTVTARTTYPSVDAFVDTEIDGTPLGDGLPDGVRAAIRARCRSDLVPYVRADGALAFDFREPRGGRLAGLSTSPVPARRPDGSPTVARRSRRFTRAGQASIRLYSYAHACICRDRRCQWLRRR
ncbi:methyltransferase domain-containing protein [Occultella kanbiaonis]|uniref:methyltransferase domain-containing protein n=1 Tax=Occultella kanbiaonis TaxID=2675754 RepID=UPI0013D5CC4D|nr:methyltransferase domain-containing protein [Occultella kanbiaonis]